MITYFDASIEAASVHYIANKTGNDLCRFSEAPLELEDEKLGELLLQYFVQPFEKIQESFSFTHASSVELNEVYHFTKQIFHEEEPFHDAALGIAKHLYEISTHPNIKPGELYIARLKNILFDGVERDAVGIFKSENKEAFLKVQVQERELQVGYVLDAINIKKLDKGCLIFNLEEEEGYKVMVIDQTNKSTEALYWIDLFLKLKVRNDEFAQTNSVLTMYKHFISDAVDEQIELSKPEKIDLLNRSIKYFKDKDSFDLNEFSSEVIGHEQGISMFKKFKDDYERKYEVDIHDQFDISSAAVKKQARIYKSVLKLDKNFHIYIHGNSELIEKGTDENGRKFYKIYYQEES